MTNAANRQDVRRKEKESKIAELEQAEVIAHLLATRTGRNYIWDQLSAAHIFHTSFSGDPLQMAFAEGERNSGLRLLNDILTYSPDNFILMLREQHVRDQLDSDRNHDGADGNPDSPVGSLDE